MKLDFDNTETYKLLLAVCSQHKIDPSSSLNSEKFFRNLLGQYNGALDKNKVIDWLNQQISHWFKSLDKRPNWIQDSKWLFVDGVPAVFAGQIDVSTKNNKIASEFFHDDTSLYVFLSKQEKPIVVIQQY